MISELDFWLLKTKFNYKTWFNAITTRCRLSLFSFSLFFTFKILHCTFSEFSLWHWSWQLGNPTIKVNNVHLYRLNCIWITILEIFYLAENLKTFFHSIDKYICEIKVCVSALLFQKNKRFINTLKNQEL